ncbi:MAG: dockerin type I repeat-containing protein [Clostridia bacterium]|nr:dockerin type I repeat-containing protein [Clostridia bacterium]
MKKVLSIVLSLVLIVLSLSCVAIAAVTMPGDVNEDGYVKATDARMILQVVAGLMKESDLKNQDNGDLNGDKQLKASDARMILQMVAGLENTPSDSTKAQIAKLFNDETAKAAKGTYNWTRTCKFTKDINVGNATGTLNQIIANIDPNASLNSVIGGFLGVGNVSGTEKDAGKCAIIPMKLTEKDIKSFTRTNTQITVLLKDSENPSKGGNTAFNHISNDFITEGEVKDALAEVTTAMTVNSLATEYKNVKMVVDLDSKGNPAVFTITYTMYAKLNLKMSVSVVGDGEVETVLKYSNFKY